MATATTAPVPGSSGLGSAPVPGQGSPGQTTPQVAETLATELDEVQWDWTCSMPIPHLTFIVNCFMPKWHPSVAITGEIKEKQDQVQRNYQERFCGDPTMKLLFSGSFNENLSVPPYFKRTWKAGGVPPAAGEILKPDLDMMIEAVGNDVGKSDKYERRIDTSSSDLLPGYLHIHVVYKTDVVSEEICVKKNGKFYLSSTKMTQSWYPSLQQKLEADGSADSVSVVVTGPAMTIQSKDTRGTVEQDVVLSLLCPEWPDEAREWINRERTVGWPPQSLRDDIVNSGCHIVPVAHRKSTWPEAEWRFSFAQAEVKLCHSLSLPQRQCYLLFKMLVKFELLPDLISSYCLKNLFFTCLEKIPALQWEDGTNSLGTIFPYLLDELMYALINHNLPHFFIPSNNLIAHIPEDFVDDLMAKVSRIRRDPVKYLLAFDKIYMFPYSPIKTTFAEALAPILEHSKKYSNKLGNCYIAQRKTCDKLIDTYIMEMQTLGAWEIAKKVSELGYYLSERIGALGFLEDRLLDQQSHHAALVYENMLSILQIVPSSTYGNLGGMYTALYCTEQMKAKRDEYCQKAESTFQKALDGQEIRCEIAVDYTVFLRKSGRSEEAIQLLLRVLPREAQSMDSIEHGTCYRKSEKPSLDDNLKAEVDDTQDDISAPSVMFGFYQLAQCYFDTKQVAKVQELIPDFEAVCKHFPKLALGYSLLGYTYQELEDYKSASEAFGKALELRPSSTLTANNKTLCDAMLLSLSEEKTPVSQ